jgi:uncharacterized membrane protein YgcG
MPPRHAYWTIILEGKPTAFRAHTEDELLPTLRQLQARHPDAVMRWFSRGRLWLSREEERLARVARQTTREARGRDWRPGGSHKDPRDRFKVPRDEKRQRFRDRLFRNRREQGRPDLSEGSPPGPDDRRNKAPSGDRRPWKPARPASPGGAGARPWNRGGPRRGGHGGGKPGGGGRKGGGGGRKGGGGRGPSR